MILLDKFPNLEKLKARIETNFNLKNNGKGFPSVIISANAKQEERNDIRASLYLFMNLEGESECRVDEKNHKINSDYFFLSNKGQPYSLFMEKPVKTFNIHFGDEFIEKLVPSLSTSYENLLENYTFSTSNFSSKTLEFPNKLYQKTPRFLSALHKIQKAHQEKYQNKFFWEEEMTQLFVYLLSERKDSISDLRRIPVIKNSTKTEIYQRLSYSMDFLQTYFHQNIDLEMLASTACLSKFHFLRLFKTVFGFSPYQYIQHLRIQKAKTLLQKIKYYPNYYINQSK